MQKICQCTQLLTHYFPYRDINRSHHNKYKIPALVSLDFLLPAVQVLIISLSFFFCINRKMLNIIKCWYFTNCHYDAYTEDINMINSWPCFFHLVTLCNELPWSIRERLVHQFNELVQIINQPLMCKNITWCKKKTI